jgi:hypothetical protein
MEPGVHLCMWQWLLAPSAHGAAKPVGWNLPVLARQWRPWDLLVPRCEFPGGTAEWDNKACWPASSDTHGAVKVQGPAHTRHRFLWHFRCRIGGHVTGGECGAQSSYMCWEIGLTTKCREMELHGDFRGWGLKMLSWKSFFLIFLFPASLFVCDFREGFASSWYGTWWVSFVVPWSSFSRVVTAGVWGCQQSAILLDLHLMVSLY